jgi:hypothetical protein
MARTTQSVEISVPHPKPNAHLRKLHKERPSKGGCARVATIWQGRCWCGWTGTEVFTTQAAAVADSKNHTCI